MSFMQSALPLSMSVLVLSQKLLSSTVTCKRLDPDQDRRSVGPDLVPNCLQGLSVDNKSGHYRGMNLNSSMFTVYLHAG